MLLDAYQGEPETAFRRAPCALKMVRVQEETPHMVCPLIALGGEAAVAWIVQDVLDAFPDVTPQELRDLEKAFRPSGRMASLATGLRWERAAHLEPLDDLPWFQPVRRRAISDYLDYISEAISRAELDYPERLSALAALRDDLPGYSNFLTRPFLEERFPSRGSSDSPTLLKRMGDECEGWVRRHNGLLPGPFHSWAWRALRKIPRRYLSGATSFGEDSRASGEALRDTFRVALVLKAYAKEHGGPPERLGDLVSEEFPTMPLDPFTGKAFVWRVHDDGKVLVYSPGADGRDNGGQVSGYRDLGWEL